GIRDFHVTGVQTCALPIFFILNQHGFLCETMSSNVFVLYDEKLYTPALSEGCVAGVMRNVVIKLAGDNGIPVIEAQINPAILNRSEERRVGKGGRSSGSR